MVLTAQSPHSTPGGVGGTPAGGSQEAVRAKSLTAVPSGETYSGEVFGIPVPSTTECRSSAEPSLTALGNTGLAAAISHWWLRNQAPKAAWKELYAAA